MAKAMYDTIGGVHRKNKKLYATIGSVHRKIKKAFDTVGGVHRQCFEDGISITIVGTINNSTYNGYATANVSGTTYNGATKSTTITVPKGTVVSLYAKYGGYGAEIYEDGKNLKSSLADANYNYTINKSVKISLDMYTHQSIGPMGNPLYSYNGKIVITSL